MLNHEEKITLQQKKKRIFFIAVLILVGVSVIITVVLLILSAVHNFIQERRWEEAQGPQRSFIFPNPDWSANIFEEEYYMSLNRAVWVSEHNDTMRTVISEENRNAYPAAIQFMYDVVHMIIRGDYEAYNAIFTNEHWENVEWEERAGRLWADTFPMQRLHNIELAIVRETETSVDVRVSYMILRNDGTFRNDLEPTTETMSPMIPHVYRLVMDEDGNIRVASRTVYRFHVPERF